jgi:hypothetical protein
MICKRGVTNDVIGNSFFWALTKKIVGGNCGQDPGGDFSKREEAKITPGVFVVRGSRVFL